MQFANRFGLESLVCTVPAASWNQYLYYTGYDLQYFVLFATYCQALVIGYISAWLGCIWGLLFVDFGFSVKLVWPRTFLIVLRFRFGCFRFPLMVLFCLRRFVL